jgi:hypothetical protein
MDRPNLDKTDLPDDGHFAPDDEPIRPSENWVRELVAFTRPGCEIQFPAREIAERDVPFVYDDFS